MGVTVGVVGVDGCQLDDGVDGHGVQRLADGERRVEGLERAAYVGQAQVADLEVNAGVGGSGFHSPAARESAGEETSVIRSSVRESAVSQALMYHSLGNYYGAYSSVSGNHR